MLVAWAVSTLALALTIEILPDLSADSLWAVIAVAAVTGVVGVLVRPILVELSARLGWLVVGINAIIGQAVVMQIALFVVPGVNTSSFWATVAAAWIAAIVGTVITWLISAATPESFAAALRRSGRRHSGVADPEVDGVLFIQLDGVPFELMQWAMQAGTLPTLRRWLDSGTHRLQEWTVQIPCTTPASQQGILHGTCARVPAFRWYDRELGRVLVANRPGDARIIEERASNGRGLLADDGMSIGNLFSGDAPRTSMTMSRTELSRGSRETRRAFSWFFVRPDGFARSLARTIAEIVRERYQSRRQRRRDVVPRVHRSWTFTLLRAVTNGLMRDVNIAVVADELMRGTRSIYTDFVDFDEVAHHAGVVRLESLAALEALDEVVAILEKVAASAPRHYHLVILSDHGQSQGQPFADRYGVELSNLCADLVEHEVAAVEESVESWGRVEFLVDDLASGKGPRDRAATSVGKRLQNKTAASDSAADSPLVVLGSGNLGLVYVREPERLLLEEIERRWPALVPGLVDHEGIGFVAAMSTAGPVAIGRLGRIDLETGEVTGADPLAPFGPQARELLLVPVSKPEAPELYVNSTFYPQTGEVAAFEGLVGCHGGLGGWQDHGTLIAPTALMPDHAHIVGADSLHRHLVSMLEKLGHRRDLAPLTGETP